MKNKTISYYDLLTLWKYNQQPQKVKLTTEDGIGIFEWSEKYYTYYASEPDKILHDYSMNSYLFDNIYDNFAFDKCIEILEESKNEISLITNTNNDTDGCISYYDLLTLVKQGIIPKKVLVKSDKYYAHYKYDQEGIYSIVFDELYDGESIDVHWEGFLNHELSFRIFEQCIKIEK